MVVGDQGAFDGCVGSSCARSRRRGRVVVRRRGGRRRTGPPGVLFEGELSFQGVEDGLDPLPDSGQLALEHTRRPRELAVLRRDLMQGLIDDSVSQSDVAREARSLPAGDPEDAGRVSAAGGSDGGPPDGMAARWSPQGSESDA